MKYSASFKLQVVKFASDNSNNSAASRKFGIDEKLVRDWRRKIDNINIKKTKISQRLPDDLEEKITSFQSFVIRARRSKNYSLVNIGNMDETPVWFDMPTSKTVDSVGAKTVLLKTTGHEKTRFTVVLACLADGTKLKPMVIFKRKTMPKDNFPAGVVVHNHPKG